jgi:fatty-acyl-CoA synthase
MQQILTNGCTISSSGTTGTPKQIFRTPENLKACNEIAIAVQMLTSKSRVYTCTRMTHAGGLLLQTLPAYTLGCDIHTTSFSAFKFITEFENYTHTFLPPQMCEAVMKTKNFATCDLTGKIVCMGSDVIPSKHIQAFIDKGATVIANWGMSEAGPNAINKTFSPGDVVEHDGIMGDTLYCETKIIDNELHIRGDICVYDDWFATGDLVELKGDVLYYLNRKT